MAPENDETVRRRYQNALDHAYTAYRYLAGSIPTDQQFLVGPVRVGPFLFAKPGNALSMRVELGWAFFTRLEAILEVFITSAGVDPQHNSLLDHLRKSGVNVPDDIADGLSVYRELRNCLHHGDGDPSLLRKPPRALAVEDGHEPHLFEMELKRYYELFSWVGAQLPLSTGGGLPS